MGKPMRLFVTNIAGKPEYYATNNYRVSEFVGGSYVDVVGNKHDLTEDVERYIDAAIAAARPHIEREVISRLLNEAVRQSEYFSERRYDDPGKTWRESLQKEGEFRVIVEWLRTYLPTDALVTKEGE